MEIVMAAGKTNKVEVIPTGAALGADVRGFDINDMTADDFDRIRAAWMAHLVLRIRGQQFDDDAHLAFGRGFGELDLAPTTIHTGKPWYPKYPEMSRITNILDDKGERTGTLGYGEACWHTDMNYRDEPPLGSMLHAIEVPKAGGETGFCNMYMALDTLPKDMRQAIEGRTLKHEKGHSSDGIIRAGLSDHATDDVRKMPGTIHPIVITHPETERDVLYLGRRVNSYIMGLPVDESEDLLDRLWAHATQDEFTWAQHWQLGDMIIWDNRAAMHRRGAFDKDERRLMHRIVIKGGQPYYAPEMAA